MDYEEEARISNQYRRAGIAGSPVDLLRSAVSVRHRCQIFSTDRDFVHYGRLTPLTL
jgi:predicted nucleic acid-binding protein